MNPVTAITPSSPTDKWLDRALIVAAVLLLVPHMTRGIIWAYESGKLPIKPRDYTLLFLGVTGFLVLLRRPTFCLPALGLLGLPILRVVDAAFLQRFDLSVLGDHSVLVMLLISNFLVSASAVLVLSASNGARIAIWVANCAVIVMTLSVYYEWLGFASFTRISGRMSGLSPDPNDAPILISLMLGVMFTLSPKFWWNLFVAALATPAVILTLSRSGTAIFAALMVAVVILNFRRHFKGLLIAAVIAIPLLGGGMVVMVSQSAQKGVVKDENTEGRMQAILELDFDKIGSSERLIDLSNGWAAVKEKPVLGHGTGAGSSRWQPHNQIVAVWIDLGLAGMLLYAFLLILVTIKCLFSGLQGVFCLIPVWLFIPCSQILLEMPHYFMAFGVAANVLFPSRLAFCLHQPRTPLPHAPTAGLPHP